MNITISAQQIALTDTLKNHVKKRFSQITKIGDKVFSADIHLRVVNKTHEITASIKGHKNFIANATNKESMYAAIDECVDKLKKQLRRDKQ